MRNVHTSSVAWSNKVTVHPQGYQIASAFGSFLGSERAQADIVQGNGVQSTPYNAYRRRVIPKFTEFISSGQTTYWITGVGLVRGHTKYAGTWSAPYFGGYLVISPVTKRPLVPLNVVNHSINSALMDAVDGKVKLGESLGEAVANAGELASVALRLLNSLKFARQGKWAYAIRALGDAKTLPKAAASTFLAWKFGVKPILQTAYGLHSAIKDAMSKDDAYLKAVGVRVERPVFLSQIVTGIFFEGELLHGAQTGLKFRVKDQWLAGLNTLDLLNPAGVAWDLVQLSFVADWILQVGNFIRGFTATAGLTLVDAYTTKFAKADGELRQVTTTGTRRWSIEEFGMDRGFTNLPTLPRLTYNFQVLNPGQLVTLVALMTVTK